MREGMRAAQRSAAVKHLTAGIIFVASRKWSEGERDDDAAPGNRKAELPTVCCDMLPLDETVKKQIH